METCQLLKKYWWKTVAVLSYSDKERKRDLKVMTEDRIPWNDTPSCLPNKSQVRTFQKEIVVGLSSDAAKSRRVMRQKFTMQENKLQIEFQNLKKLLRFLSLTFQSFRW